MAMRVYSQQEFDEELEKRGCSKTTYMTPDGLSVAWERQDGQHFLVPLFEDGRYPDFILDQIIEANDLPNPPH